MSLFVQEYKRDFKHMDSDTTMLNGDVTTKISNLTICYLYYISSYFFSLLCIFIFVKVNAKLDYEKETRYAFDVKAFYKSIPTLSSTVRVEVQVNDQNDHTPVFTETEFRRQIDENVRSGSFFLSVYAEDADHSRENSLVTYSIIGDVSLPFSIGLQSGEVRVDGSLDHEKASSYRFEIQATDNGKPPATATVQVSVNVTDLNDNAPIIGGCGAPVIVQERKPIGSDLVSLNIRDVDSDANGAPFACTMLNGDVTKFKVVSVEGGTKCVVMSKEHFEKKTKDEYKIQIRVSDSGVFKTSV